jgi:hypothetical protein
MSMNKCMDPPKCRFIMLFTAHPAFFAPGYWKSCPPSDTNDSRGMDAGVVMLQIGVSIERRSHGWPACIPSVSSPSV